MRTVGKEIPECSVLRNDEPCRTPSEERLLAEMQLGGHSVVESAPGLRALLRRPVLDKLLRSLLRTMDDVCEVGRDNSTLSSSILAEVPGVERSGGPEGTPEVMTKSHRASAAMQPTSRSR